MSRAASLAALARLAAMRRDAALARLRAASLARTETRQALARLAADLSAARSTAAAAPELAPAAERFGDWAALRRGRLNIRLARETALWLGCRQEAAEAVGRLDVLERLVKREETAVRAQRARRRQE